MDMLPAAQSSMAIHMGTGRRQDLSCGNSLSSIGCLRAPPALILDIEQACGCCNQQGSACRIQLCAGTAGRREHRCCVVRQTRGSVLLPTPGYRSPKEILYSIVTGFCVIITVMESFLSIYPSGTLVSVRVYLPSVSSRKLNMPSSPLVTVAITFPLASVNVNSALETALPLIPSTFFTQKPAKGMRAQTVLDSFTVGDSFV